MYREANFSEIYYFVYKEYFATNYYTTQTVFSYKLAIFVAKTSCFVVAPMYRHPTVTNSLAVLLLGNKFCSLFE